MLLHSPPDLLIVDEAHLATRRRGTDPKARGQQQRYDLVKALTADSNRHAVLVTATPHAASKKTSAHFSVCSILNLILAHCASPLATRLDPPLGDPRAAHQLAAIRKEETTQL
jgi:hypothetical protein